MNIYNTILSFLIINPIIVYWLHKGNKILQFYRTVIISSSQLRIHYLVWEIKHSGYIVEFICDCYTYLGCLCVRIATKNVKYSECNKNNKRYVDVSWDSLDHVKDNIYEKLDIILNDLEIIQTHIYQLKYILYLTKKHIE